MVPGSRAKAPAVLIVDDEPLVRLCAVETVEDAGFEVIEAANADEAIRILESRSDIHVVFTDVHMPGSMDGLKLAHAVRNRWPPIKIIVTSGREKVAEQDLPAGGRFVAKPYDPSGIRDALRAWAF
jgi:CheY-like chemotaxis protein